MACTKILLRSVGIICPLELNIVEHHTFGDLWILKLISNLGSMILDLGAYPQLLELLNLGTYLKFPFRNHFRETLSWSTFVKHFRGALSWSTFVRINPFRAQHSDEYVWEHILKRTCQGTWAQKGLILTKVLHKSAPRKCFTKVLHESASRKCFVKVVPKRELEISSKIQPFQ